MKNNTIVIINIGDTGAGKSCFGNLFLDKEVFHHTQSPFPVTTEEEAGESIVQGMKRIAIDTEGLEDGQNRSSKQIKNLTKFIHHWDKGFNAISIILNGQNPHFSQSVKDIIQFAY